MNIQPALVFKAQLLKRIAEREFSERTGVHTTDLVYCLNKQAMRKLQPEKPTENEMLTFSLGWATQRWLTGQDKDVPEKIVDGITVTLDSETTESADGARESTCFSVPWELKATFQSSNKAIYENIHWVRQIMSQCYVSGVRVAYLSRLEIMGDWGSVFAKGSTKEEKEKYKQEHSKPTLSCYRLEFTNEELAIHWAWMQERKRLFEGILATGKLLPVVHALAPGMQWECGFCTKRGQCEGGKLHA